MEKMFRIIDANINRAAEGLRVIEDLARFYLENRSISEKAKKLRHSLRMDAMPFMNECLMERDSENDLGLDISKKLKVDVKKDITELITANFKRIQEAVRTIEEAFHGLGHYDDAKKYELYRFQSYSLEKDFALTDSKRKIETDLYCLTAEEYSRGRNNIEVVADMISAEIKVIQYREKEKSLREKLIECEKIRAMTSEAGVTFIVNDDISVAQLVRADGIHIGQDDLPIKRVRELTGDKMIIGISTHSPRQAEEAVNNGADYIGVGPIFKTSTKKNVCDPVGLSYLEYAVKNINIPFVTIGGIKEHNMHEVINKGARCIAMVTEIVGAGDIKGKINSIREKIKTQSSPKS